MIAVDSAEEATRVFGRQEVQIILVDQRTIGTSWVQFLEWVRQQAPRTARLLLSVAVLPLGALEALNPGLVHHYLTPPWQVAEVLQVLRAAAAGRLPKQQRELLAGHCGRVRLLEALRRLNRERLVAEQRQALERARHLLQRRSRQLETLALTDPLAGLLNRRAIEDVTRAEVERHLRYRRPLALGLIDADHFRTINQRYHFSGGDQVLRALAQIIRGAVRPMDAVGRIGGAEFLVIAPSADWGGTLALAERIRLAVERSPTAS